MTATIDFAMQFKKLHESGMQVSNICGCLEFHPSCIPAFLESIFNMCRSSTLAEEKRWELLRDDRSESSLRDDRTAHRLCQAMQGPFESVHSSFVPEASVESLCYKRYNVHRLKALAEIYAMHSFAQLCNLNFLPNFAENVAELCKIQQT